jgi:oleate hydratase
MVPNPDPRNVQAWLIGSGIASLAAAVNLIKRAKVPANQVHILDIHKGSGGALEGVTGNPSDGYILHTGAQPSFHEDCVEKLLTEIPSIDDPEKSVLDVTKRDFPDWTLGNKTKTRAFRLNEESILKVDAHRTHIGEKLRMELIEFLLDHEKVTDSKISEVFDETFFGTEFWAFWSTT